MTELEKNMEVCNLMNVSNQKRKRIQIMVECNAWLRRTSAGKVTNFCLPTFGKLKVERFFLPKCEGIRDSFFRDVKLKCT